MLKLLLLFVVLNGLCFIICHVFDCHDDPAFEPEEGLLSELQFNWLGALQYIHVKDGTPHYFRAPRVCLVTKQFVISTARDAAQIPEGYALGNVVFGEYERDESECKLTIEQIAGGAECDPAVLFMPIADVLLHPEYKHFGIKSSIALLKLLTPVKSKYMLPACLPYKNFLFINGKQVSGMLIHVDFSSEVPRDFVEEEKEVIYLETVNQDLCFLYDNPQNATYLPGNRYICTTGCDLQSGAPSVVHEHTGHWNIVALSEGGAPCPDPLRSRGPSSPSRHILLHPYVPWITTAISGKPVGGFSKDDPFGYVMPRTYISQRLGRAWVGHWWLGGIRCYDRGDTATDIFRFYHEIFQIKPKPEKIEYITFYLEITSAYSFKIVCVKVGMPYQMQDPMVWGMNSDTVKVRIPLILMSSFYEVIVEAWYTSSEIVSTDEGETEEVDSDDSSSSSEDEGDEEKGRGKGKKKDEKKENEKGQEKDKGKQKPNSDESDEEALKPPDAGVEKENK